MKKHLNQLRWNAFLAISIILLSVSTNIAQNKTKQLDELLNKYTEYGQFNGSVLVAEKGKVIYKKGFGMANFEWDIPNDVDTKHRLGSITKQFTAMLIMQLVAEGKVELNTPISKYLPDYPKMNGDKITIHHLLTHTSGTPNYTSFPGFFDKYSRNPYKVNELVKTFSDSTLTFAPGERFSYSNSGYILLGEIIEKVSGKKYEQMLQDKIFNPLNMKNSGYDHHNAILKKRATGYSKNGVTVENSDYLDMSIPYAAGSLYSTVEDLFIWDQALYTEKLLSKKYMDMLFEKYTPANGEHYGYGWQLGKMQVGTSTENIDFIGHGGGINGFNTLITRLPSENNTVILLNNTGGAPLNDITEAILGIEYGKPYDLPKQSLANAVLDEITTKNLKAGVVFYEKNKSSKKYSFKENEFNSVGYELLRSGKLAEAEAVLKWNIESFPKSSNVYDSYGEVLMKQGKNELAIENYKKSLELDPSNQNAIDMLKNLGIKTDGLVKDVSVSNSILESYVGKYELLPGFILTVTKEGNQLSAQATGQSAAGIYPKSDTEFYLKVVKAEIKFNKNKEGKVESLTLFQAGQEMTGKRLE